MMDIPPNPLEKPGYVLEFNDEFDENTLDAKKWIPYYLPQWSSREQSRPRYSISDGMLQLRIEHDQQPWCPDFDGDVKVSSLQTGLYSGPVGSEQGQHRFNEQLIVREAQPTQRTYTPQYGYFEARVAAAALPGYLCALWMIGFEEKPRESGEIAIFELFGEHMQHDRAEVRYGIHPWADPGLSDAFYHEIVSINASQFHVYAAEWTPTHVDFYVDNVKQHTVRQSPQYPMQFMLGIYELPGASPTQDMYPVVFKVDYFRGYQPINGY